MKTLVAILAMISSFPAWAAKESNRDPKDVELMISEFYQIYRLAPERRSPEDRIVVRGSKQQGYQVEISYWNSLKSKDPAQEICNAYQWVLFGRGAYGRGAVESFTKIPELREISLRFFDIEFTTKVGKKKAEILPAQRVIPYLRVGVTRNSILTKKPNATEVEGFVSKGQCAEVGNRYVESRWFDQDYLRQGR